MFINNRMASNTERVHNSFWRNVSARAKQKLLRSKVLIVGKITWRLFGHLRAKVVIVGGNKWDKNHHRCAQLPHCFSIYLKKIFSWLKQLLNCDYPLIAISTSVNNCCMQLFTVYVCSTEEPTAFCALCWLPSTN